MKTYDHNGDYVAGDGSRVRVVGNAPIPVPNWWMRLRQRVWLWWHRTKVERKSLPTLWLVPFADGKPVPGIAPQPVTLDKHGRVPHEVVFGPERQKGKAVTDLFIDEFHLPADGDDWAPAFQRAQEAAHVRRKEKP